MTVVTSTSATRDRSAGALKGFFRIADRWGLNRSQRKTLLGTSDRSVDRWQANPGSADLTHDQLERISYVLGIYGGLHALLGDSPLADEWVRRPNTDFGGHAPSIVCWPGMWAISLTCGGTLTLGVSVGKRPILESGASPRSATGAELNAFGALVEGDANDLQDILEVLGITDPRYRDAAGTFRAFPATEQYRGSSAAAVMMPFLTPKVSRFSAGLFGILYGAESVATSTSEIVHHQSLRLRATSATAGTVILLAHWQFTLDRDMVDVRRFPDTTQIHDPDSYVASQALGRRLKHEGAAGVLYHSVRRPPGECVAVFQPSAIRSMARHEDWLMLWDGSAIAEILSST